MLVGPDLLDAISISFIGQIDRLDPVSIDDDELDASEITAVFRGKYRETYGLCGGIFVGK